MENKVDRLWQHRNRLAMDIRREKKTIKQADHLRAEAKAIYEIALRDIEGAPQRLADLERKLAANNKQRARLIKQPKIEKLEELRKLVAKMERLLED